MSRKIPELDFKGLMNKTLGKSSTQVLDIIPEESTPILTDTGDDFLGDLNNDKFISKSEIEKQNKQKLKEQKEQEKNEQKQSRQRKQFEKEQEKNNKKSAKTIKDEENELFTEQGSEIYGRDKLKIIAKIQQYKLLFPEIKALQKLKVKKNPSLDELHIYLTECEALVETDTLEQFLTDSILQTFKMVEYASVRTKYNISGLSEMLRLNPQFNSLSKQLYLKYKVFSQVPPEYQMLMLVSTSAWICLQKNKKDEISISKKEIFNKPVNTNMFDDTDNEEELEEKQIF